MEEKSRVVRTYEEESAYVTPASPCAWDIARGFVPNMTVPDKFYVNQALKPLMFQELEAYCSAERIGGFLPAMKQIANVAALPGIVGASIGLPDVHSGYGFAIGNVAACTCSE